MTTIDDIELVRERSNRASPFDPADEKPLRRFIERMIGEGFAMVVVRGERPNGLEDVVAWFQDECERVQAQMYQVNLGQFTFNNPWLELDQTIGKVSAAEKTILLLHSVDPLSERKRDDEVPLFRQLNVQRDALTRDYPCFWVLYIPPRLEYQLKSQAPDFCDFVGYWCTIQPSETVFSPLVRSNDSNRSYSSPSGTPESDAKLLTALGNDHLFASLKATWDWKLDEARGRIAIYEMSSKRNGNPGALEFVRGYLQFQEGNRHAAETSYTLANDKIDGQTQPQLKAELDNAWGQLHQSQGKPEKALELYRSALAIFERLGDERSKAATMGSIADIHEQRGEIDEALRIYRDECVTVYERLGDIHQKAVTMGRIADILQHRGEIDEALRIRRVEELPVYERLGDIREKAITMGQIADILMLRGQTDEVLRIRIEEEIPVYNQLGDVRSKAVTMGKIAEILMQRGQIDEALRIRREEELPVYKRLGDVRLEAMTMGKIADIHQQRGEIDEALRNLEAIKLVFHDLGDARSEAITWGKIADIVRQRGQTDEALRIRREEELPVYERLGDVREKAVTMGNIAIILEQRGEIHEAIRIYREIVPILENLNDLHSQMNCRYNLGTALLTKGYKKDIPIAREHLLWALATAEKHQYAEAAQLRANVQRLLGGSE